MPRSLLVGAVVFCAVQLPARAEVTSDAPAAILVFPKVLVDITSPQVSPPAQIDTLIRVTNTSDRPISMWCFYVNATPHCTNNSGSCLARPVTCDPTACLPQWQETDFVVSLTPGQPIAWLASRGGVPCQESAPGLPCFSLGVQGLPPNRVQPVPEDPFLGELKCIAVDRNLVPVARNELKGEVEIIRSGVSPDSIDVEAYNAIGIPAIRGTTDGDDTNNGDNTLVLGGGVCIGGANAQLPCAAVADCPGGRCSAEYSSCPNILILDHFLDGAADPISGKKVTTHVTFVPCSEDFATQSPTTTTVQFIIFNEFEQRFSTSRRVTCFQEFKISDIDKANENKSIFSAAVNGTLTAQTRIRGVADDDSDHGHTLLGVAEEFREGGGTAALNLHFHGRRPQSDFIRLP
ncbi:MAG: hypothetical protein ACE5I7_08620 [Candidatus Binatia bacterium]